jgi:hypothetical protein
LDASRIIKLPRFSLLGLIQVSVAEARGATDMLVLTQTVAMTPVFPSRNSSRHEFEDLDWWPPYLRDAWQIGPRNECYMRTNNKFWDDEFRIIRTCVLAMAAVQLNLDAGPKEID